MKKFLLLLLPLIFSLNSSALEISADLFTYDEKKVESELNNLSLLESYIINNNLLEDDSLQTFHPLVSNKSDKYLSPYSPGNISAPGNLPSFWFTFTLSAIGTYTIYGVVTGPISVGIVYFSTKRNKKETKKALWGCITGTIFGAGIKYAVIMMK